MAENQLMGIIALRPPGELVDMDTGQTGETGGGASQLPGRLWLISCHPVSLVRNIHALAEY